VIAERYEQLRARVDAGEPIADADLEQLAAGPDIITLGSLADAVRRHAHGVRTTYSRVAVWAHDQPLADGVPPAAGEIRLTGRPASLGHAVNAVRAAKAVAETRLVSGFSLVDLSEIGGASLAAALAELRGAGLEMVADVPLDRMASAERAIEAMATAGFEQVRLTIDRAPAPERYAWFTLARDLRARFPAVTVLNPLPMTRNAFKPTTGYEDTKSVAIARLAATGIPTIQVDWLRYGPKLAQVALTFGADDLDGVSPVDDASEGTRRMASADVIRNIEAAGFVAVERDGRFSVR
jgi:aminodeoxyfutalosine synthase